MARHGLCGRHNRFPAAVGPGERQCLAVISLDRGCVTLSNCAIERTVTGGQGEERVDSNRFDNLARIVGEQTDRRRMLKVAAGSALAVAGLGALSRTALGEDVSAESNGFKGDSCENNSDCKKGLICNTSNTNPRCEYRNNCGAKKGQACK